jgi:PIN domain nuclease of toxin-antitoxin system
MQLLLDTHVFLWWVDNDQRLSERARLIITDGANELFLSAASSWEIAIKAQLGKLILPANLEQFISKELDENYITIMPIQLSHTLAIYRLPVLHRDPFDRMLVTQSQFENIPILTADPLIKQYNVQSIW